MTNDFPSLPSRLLGMFTSPGAVFEKLAQRPVWIGAILVAAVLVGLSTILAPAELFEATVREQLQNSGQPIPDSLSAVGLFAKIAGTAAAVIVDPLMTALMAGIVTLIFVFAMGGSGTYKQYLAATTHAFFIPALSALALLPLKISAGDLQLRFSIGTFLPFLEDGWLASGLSWLDLFGLWGWVLVALGVSKIDPKRSWGSAATIILTLVVVLTMGGALIFAR